MKRERTSIWACGGGTQSSAIAALIVGGRLPKPELAVIVDTEREMSTTWDYVRSVLEPSLASVGVALHRVRKSKYETRDLQSGTGTLLVPVFTTQNGRVGKLSNYCSSYWKREIIKRWANAQGVKAATIWLGISTDEKRRVQPHRSDKWHQGYPLIDLGMSRADCVAAVAAMGWPPPPKSRCRACPNQTQDEWREVKASPVDWLGAVADDQAIRALDPHAFVHSDCVPLEQADLSDPNGVLFGHECQSGHCFT